MQTIFQIDPVDNSFFSWALACELMSWVEEVERKPTPFDVNAIVESCGNILKT